ncbi:homocysteine S-methyltransferase family protein [Desulfonatronovibrio hydrogenovorans]|uniref:homocysteine S-methyltransferase family protein n=1 Tax=Desulfonatronovibrio hydrogenovorans TaxID=53245 RepID=UPI00048DF5B5|nr:homocysteine S-methyltransferase family protein [Desulfonatronovibrio hydrogenovorans]
MRFSQLLNNDRIIIFDGGMGTLLQSRGLKPGQSPEDLGLARPEIIREIHSLYISAGSRIITANTFGGTRYKLRPDVDPLDFNRKMAEIAVLAAEGRAIVAGSVGPTGKILAPLGDISFPELLTAFKEQIKGLALGGADLILAETHFDLAEARAVVIAAREVCDLPVAVSMTFEKGQSLTGTPPSVFLDTMQNLGVDIIAINCSSGPEDFIPLVKSMLPRLETPLLIQPNAGLPVLENGQTVFKLGPEDFAQRLFPFLKMGVKFLGGCCGTTPDHIKALSSMVRDYLWHKPEPEDNPCIILTSRSRSVPFGFSHDPVLVGERINPTGKNDLIKQLQGFELTRALELAEEQMEQGAQVLDVNVGAPMVDEPALLPALTRELVSKFDFPLCIDSSSIQAIKNALLEYPGSPLVNSISGEQDKMDLLGPLCRDMGAPFILLPLEGNKLPATAGQRIKIINRLLEKALDLNIPKRLILVDALALTLSSHGGAAKDCLTVIRHCRDELGLGTIMGLSNISFGLPARELVNSTFLAMCLCSGMSSLIANPGSARLMETLSAARVVLGHDPMAQDFIQNYSSWKPSGVLNRASAREKSVFASSLQEAVIKGKKESIVRLIKDEIKNGRGPFEIVSQEMIPAINIVGEKYEKREYFLPQLILSAETMKTGFEFLKPMLKKNEEDQGPTVVMATVEGDIHDIGKNIVSLMLRNYGFNVVDLGKDVQAGEIVDTAERLKAKVIGLSALMTTTMVKMEETIALVRQKSLNCRVMVGGAVVTQAFADRIRADGYAEDAVAAVKLAQQLSRPGQGES